MAAVLPILAAAAPEILEGVQILSGLAGAAWSIAQIKNAIQAHANAHPEDVERLKAENPSLAAKLPQWLDTGPASPDPTDMP